MKTAGSNTLRMRVALTSVGKQLNDLSWYQDLPITLAVRAANELVRVPDRTVYLFVEADSPTAKVVKY